MGRITYGAGDMYYKKKKIGSFMRVSGLWHFSFYKDKIGFCCFGNAAIKEDAQELAEAKLAEHLKSAKA